jgi:hypothetical protein
LSPGKELEAEASNGGNEEDTADVERQRRELLARLELLGNFGGGAGSTQEQTALGSPLDEFDNVPKNEGVVYEKKGNSSS